MGQLILLRTPISVRSRSSLGGREEYRGPLGNLLDFHDDTGLFGTQSYEKAESEMQRMTFSLALNRAGLSHKEIDLLFAGDLQNQCTASSNGLSSFHVPYFGLYGACSTFGEGWRLPLLPSPPLPRFTLRQR